MVEETPTDRWDLLETAICPASAAAILFAPHDV
jgi:drug/metabolite transporter superfamily protein YnfA